MWWRAGSERERERVTLLSLLHCSCWVVLAGRPTRFIPSYSYQ
jgi:hypothetical protein